MNSEMYVTGDDCYGSEAGAAVSLSVYLCLSLSVSLSISLSLSLSLSHSLILFQMMSRLRARGLWYLHKISQRGDLKQGYSWLINSDLFFMWCPVDVLPSALSLYIYICKNKLALKLLHHSVQTQNI